MTHTLPEDIYNRFTGDEYSLPPSSKLEVLIEDAEDILFDEIPSLPERIEENDALKRKVKRVVSAAIIRYSITGSEGISSHQMTIGGASEMVSYVDRRNKSSIYFTDDELDSLRDAKKKPRLALVDLYGSSTRGNHIIGYHGKTGIYSVNEAETEKTVWDA